MSREEEIHEIFNALDLEMSTDEIHALFNKLQRISHETEEREAQQTAIALEKLNLGRRGGLGPKSAGGIHEHAHALFLKDESARAVVEKVENVKVKKSKSDVEGAVKISRTLPKLVTDVVKEEPTVPPNQEAIWV